MATWLTDREEAAWRALLGMHARLTRELADRLAADSSLSYQDYAVLVALTDEPSGRLRQFHLADQLGWEKSRLSHQVRRMVDRGLLAKELCEEDRRGFVVSATARGERAIAAAAPGHVAAVRELFIERLTPTELDTITRAAGAVLAGLEAASR